MAFFKKNVKNEQEEKQIALDIEYPRWNFISRFKRIARDVENKYDLMPLWRSAMTWILVLTTVFSLIVCVIFLIRYFNDLPPEIPFIYNTQTSTWVLAPKLFIILIPMFLVTFGYISLQVIKRVFFINKRVSIILSLGTVIANILAIITISQIIFLTI